jgi:hypothetical protein
LNIEQVLFLGQLSIPGTTGVMASIKEVRTFEVAISLTSKMSETLSYTVVVVDNYLDNLPVCDIF